MRIVTTILFVFILTWGQAQKTTLSLNLKEGESYRQVMKSKVNINQDLGAQTMDMVIIVGCDMTYHVTEVIPTGYKMSVQYDRLDMTMQLPQANMEFNSEETKEGDVLSNVLSSMKNKPFYVTMTKTGMVEEVSNIDTLFGQLPDLPEMQKQQMKTMLQQSYGDKAFKGNIEMVTAVLPDKPVKKGEKWTVETKLESGMLATVVSTYELNDIRDNQCIIQGKSTIATTDKDAYIESNGMPMKFDLNGTMTSQLTIDKATGWIVEATINQDIQGDVYIKESPQMPNGMKIPMTMVSEMIIKDK